MKEGAPKVSIFDVIFHPLSTGWGPAVMLLDMGFSGRDAGKCGTNLSWKKWSGIVCFLLHMDGILCSLNKLKHIFIKQPDHRSPKVCQISTCKFQGKGCLPLKQFTVYMLWIDAKSCAKVRRWLIPGYIHIYIYTHIVPLLTMFHRIGLYQGMLFHQRLMKYPYYEQST